MGTRSLTYVYNSGSTEPMVCMYRQFDGYPSGHGAELAEFLNSGRIVNGLPLGSKERLFNGMGCLAAQMVAEFKDGPGGIYLHAPELNQDVWQDYEYHVFEDSVVVKTNYEGTDIFSGNWQEFAEFCSADELA